MVLDISASTTPIVENDNRIPKFRLPEKIIVKKFTAMPIMPAPLPKKINNFAMIILRLWIRYAPIKTEMPPNEAIINKILNIGCIKKSCKKRDTNCSINLTAPTPVVPDMINKTPDIIAKRFASRLFPIILHQ